VAVDDKLHLGLKDSRPDLEEFHVDQAGARPKGHAPPISLQGGRIHMMAEDPARPAGCQNNGLCADSKRDMIRKGDRTAHASVIVLNQIEDPDIFHHFRAES
jgi:hypothetical protein